MIKKIQGYSLNVIHKITHPRISSFDRFNVHKWKQTNITPIFNEKKEIQNYIVVESDITRIKEAEQKLQEEKDKTDKLLLNILPEETAEELKTKGKATPRFYRSASVLFADIQDFTKLAENLTPDELVHDLQSYFSRFDDAVSKYFVEKIKTMGDAFLCVGGIPMRNKSHPFDTVLVGLELQRIIKEIGKEREETGRRALQLRIGIHSGPIVAGVVGKQKMTYDIWGDTVNIAKRIETACVAGMINVSSSTYEIIKPFFECEYRGKILAKHKGHIDMYFVHRIKPEFSVNSDGITPNDYFMETLAQL
jgi:class 3 adenylate cyclase